MMTLETMRLFVADDISDSAISPLADNLILLGYRREHGTISRTITVVKTRATTHDPSVRTFMIGSMGRPRPDQIAADRCYSPAAGSQLATGSAGPSRQLVPCESTMTSS